MDKGEENPLFETATGEYIKFCPREGCEFGGFISVKDEIFTCASCGNSVCPKCNRTPHIGNSCQAETEVQPDMGGGDYLKFVQCPYCGINTEKSDGCNFMACQSVKCRGRNFFCFLCRSKLDQEEHYSHYRTYGPYGDICNQLEK